MYRDSIEIDEIKMPLLYRHVRVMKDSPGPGRYRGGAAVEAEFGPIGDQPITVIYPCDGQETPPKGVLGGSDGQLAEGWVVRADGSRTKLPPNAEVQIQPGETIIGVDSSGSGYGDPLTRDPAAVLHDVVEKWISPETAETAYGVVLIEGEHSGSYRIDDAATDQRRSTLATTGTDR
jgi:N-methylhydantoinase B